MARELRDYFLPSINISISPPPIDLEEMEDRYGESGLPPDEMKALFTRLKILEFNQENMSVIETVVRDWNRKGTFFDLFKHTNFDTKETTIVIGYNLFKEKYLEKLPQDIAALKAYLNEFKKINFKFLNPTNNSEWDINTREFETTFYDELQAQTIRDLGWKKRELRPVFESAKPKYSLTETDGTVLITPPPSTTSDDW